MPPSSRTSGAPVRELRVSPPGIPAEQSPEFQTALALAFAPLHKRAFGIAIGTAFGALIFLMTVLSMFRGAGRDADFSLSLLSEYFYGYTVSWTGAFIGFAWGLLSGFVAGWFFAFWRNFVLAASVFVIRTRAELSATRDFLDHV
jgi:hypothetical protein